MVDIGIVAPLFINNADGITTGNIAKMNAGQITIKNSRLVYDSVPLDGVEFIGDVIVYVPSVSGDWSVPLFTNVVNEPHLQIHSIEYNPLYGMHTYYNDDSIFALPVRETDYVKILHNDMGRFINLVREYEPQDKLLSALDGATTLNELYDVMDASVKLHPIRLMDSLRTIANMEINFPQKSSGFHTGMMQIWNNDYSVYMARAGVGFKFRAIDVVATMYVGAVDASDDVNEYIGAVYGGNVFAEYNFDDTYFVRTMGGASIGIFDSGIVFDGNSYVTFPAGGLIYAASDFGARYYLDKSIYIDGFVGATIDYATILHENDLNSDARIGIDAVYNADLLGIKYDYRAGVRATAMGAIGAGFQIGFVSEWDAAGGNVSLDILRDDRGVSYRAGFNLRLWF